MLKLLGTAVAAMTLAFGGSAGATTYLIESGSVTLGDTPQTLTVYLRRPEPAWHAWEVEFTSSAPLDSLDRDIYAKRHWHVEHDNPAYPDYGGNHLYYLTTPSSVTLLPNGFRVRFDIPYDKDYYVDFPDVRVHHWEAWNLGGWVGGRFLAGEGEVSYLVTMTSVPEPATWAMMIVGFGLVGTGVRRAHRRRVGAGSLHA